MTAFAFWTSAKGVAGPMAAMLMADFAADVVKIEPPRGDRLKDHPGYLAFNRNKRVVTLDLDRADDLRRARELIAAADVVQFDHAPGVLERLRLDAPTLTAAHPSLVHAWMPPYGTQGAWSQLPPHHSLLTALSGVAFRQGAYGDQPVHLILPLVWYGQAVTGAAAIGAALFERTHSGLGQAVTVSGLHGVAEVTGPVRGAGRTAAAARRAAGRHAQLPPLSVRRRPVAVPGDPVRQLLRQGDRGHGA